MCGARVQHPLHAQGRGHGPRSQYRACGACSVRRQAVPRPRVRAGCALRDPVPALQGAAGMKVKYLLYVEDRVDQQLTFRDAVADWNLAHAEEGRAFEYEIRDDYPSGLEALSRYRFDAALVDLRLPSLEPGEEEAPIGSDLAEKVLRGNGIPVAIITANDAELETGFQRSEERRVGKECVSKCRSRWAPDQ